MATNLIYAYCVLNTQPAFAGNIKFKRLKSMKIGDFYVVVKYISSEEFSEENFDRSCTEIEQEEFKEHVEVITSLMEQNTVLPFEFGTVFYTENCLRKFVTDCSDSLFENLYLIKGCEEWSVKIYFDRKLLSEQIDELSEEAAALEKQIMDSSPGRAFLLRRKKNGLVENEMDRICKNYGQNYYEEFEKLSVSTCSHNLLPKEFTGRKDAMILNAAFLISKTKTNEFRNTVETLRNKYRIFGVFIDTSGPSPPFSFVNIKSLSLNQ